MAQSSGHRWVLFAVLGAFFAAIVSVLNKRALSKTDLVTALVIQTSLAAATVAVLYLSLSRSQHDAKPQWAWLLLAVSGVATGLSWFFGYRALQLTDVAKSTPLDKLSLPMAVIFAMIFLAERPSVLSWVGIGMMLIGSVCVARG